MLEGRLSGRVAAPHVALVNFTMHHPFGHCRSWAAHEAAIFQDSPKRLGSATRLIRPPSLGMWWRDGVAAYFDRLTGRTN